MIFYCTKDFKHEFAKLLKNNSYKNLEKLLISDVLKKTLPELISGTKLFINEKTAYIKNRVGGRGDFRIYCYIIITSENIYLLFIHPKTGSKGSSNTTPEARTRFYKEIIEKIDTDDDFYIVSHSGKKVTFTEKKKEVTEDKA